MDLESRILSDDEMLPPDEMSVKQSKSEWRPANKRSRLMRLHRVRLAIAWLALVLIGGTTIWSLTWLRPQRKIRLSLIGASYTDNLSVSHNVFGWNDLSELASLAHNDPALDQIHVTRSPVVFNHDTKWDSDLEQASEETIVVYFSAHGAADEQGAYLMPFDCQPNENTRLDLKTIIERLSRLPEHKEKLLILDASHFQANWQYGILHNDFGRALKGLNEQIKAVPNLVVYSAAGENQLAWDCASKKQSAFGYFLVEGIRGAAGDQNNNGRIDAEDIFRFTHTNVKAWVQTAFQKTQSPILLPLGAEGLARAGRLEFATRQQHYQARPQKRAVPASTAQLKKIWNAYHELFARSVKPYTYAPGQWRKYEQAILRYEQLIQANDLLAANRLLEQISSLQHQFEWEQERSLAAASGNLFIGKSILGQQGNPEQAKAITDKLWAAESTRYAAIWKQSLSQNQLDDSSIPNVRRLRIEVLTLLYERAMSDPVGLLPRSVEIATNILDPLEPVPAEINFLMMVGRHLPAESWHEANADVIRMALDVRLLAEKVAVTFEPDSRACSEGVFPWIADEVLAADQLRLLGEDLLFAGTAQRERALDFFKQARKAYTQADDRGQRVREAYLLSTELAYGLPHLSSWVAEICGDNAANDKRRIKSFERLLKGAHQLNAMLAKQDFDSIDNQPAGAEVGQSRSLVRQTDLVANEFAALQKRFEAWWLDQSADQTPDLWHDITLALSIPHGKPKTRMTLIENQANLLVASPVVLTKNDGDGAANEVVVSPAVSEKLKADVLNHAQIQGRLALAIIGKAAFEQARDSNDESFVRLQHRLDVLGTEEHWWNSMHVAGDQVQHSLSHLSGIDEDFADSNKIDYPSLLAASSVNGFLGGDGGLCKTVSPNAKLRDRHQSTLFASLAQRTLNGHWYDVDERPYYQEASRRYLQTAKRLWAQNIEISRLEKSTTASTGLKITCPDRIDLTTEAQLPFQIGVQSETQNQEMSGFPLLWVAESGSLSLTRPLLGEKLVQKLVQGSTPTPESCLLQNPIDAIDMPSLEVGQDEIQNTPSRTAPFPTAPFPTAPFPTAPFRNASFQKTNGLNNSAMSVQVAGFFRGQPMARTIDVRLHQTPAVAMFEFTKPTTASLAVVASDEMQGFHGTGSGAVAIVIDASGSMGAAQGQKFNETTKYAEATRAIQEVLESLPDGIQVSIWVFGQAVGTQKTVRNAEETIQRLVAPTEWNVADSGQIQAIMKNISWPNIEPWNESPIIETVLAAKQDVVGKEGFKTVLLLTDGMDNRFEDSNQNKVTVSDALRTAFDKTGVSLNVVGFKVTSKEQQQSREQFQIVENLSPAGKYFEVRDSRILADTLKSVLHQRIRYWVDDYANASLSTRDRKTLEVGFANAGTNWFPEPLGPGSYSLWTNASKKPFSLLLNRGDQLVVELNQKDNQIVCHRASVLEKDFATKATKSAAGWKVAALENRFIETSQELSLLVGMEQITSANPSAVELIRPHDVWFEVREAGSGIAKQPVTWNVDRDYTVPAWRLAIADWDKRQGGVENLPVTPVLEVWWSPDRSTAAAVRFERGRDYEKISELVGKTMDVDGVSIQIEDIRVENRIVKVDSKTNETQSCLVVRLKHAPDHNFWVKPIGNDFEGQEQRSYQEIGRYSGVFWPVTQDQVDEVISGLSVFALNDLKRQAESRGFHLLLDNLQSPRPDDVAHPPLNGIQTR